MNQFLFDDDRMIVLKQVYNHLQDEESKSIYLARSKFSLSDEKDYLRTIVREMSISKELMKWTKEKDRLVLFGAGTWGDAITYYFNDIKWEHVIDNNRVGGLLNGYKISSVGEVYDIKNCNVVVAVLFKYQEVERQLLEMGINKESIFVPAKLVEERQYFDLPELSFKGDEVFIDCGGFNGDTSAQFIKRQKGKFDHIYIFEPNRSLAEKCMTKLGTVENCTIITKGTWNKNGSMRFLEAEEGSRYDKIAENEIETVTIDNVLNGTRASFIKMDVEGAEYNSLIGARETIMQYKPKLAISVYHKRNDIWEIPMLILKYNSDYRFFLRTYSFTGNDTVLYAI